MVLTGLMKYKVKIETLQKIFMVFKDRDTYTKVLAIIGLIVLNALFSDTVVTYMHSITKEIFVIKCSVIGLGVLSGMLFKWR